MILSSKIRLRTGTTPDRHRFFGIQKHAQDRFDVTNPFEHSELMTHVLDFLEIREIREFSKKFPRNLPERQPTSQELVCDLK